MDVILNYLVEKWPEFVIIIITSIVVWFVSKLYHRFIKIEGKTNDLPCNKHEDLYPRFVNIERKTKDLPCSKHEDVFHGIKEELIAIRTYLTIKDPKVADAFSQKKSPRELNEAGMQLYSDINGKSFLDKNKDILIKDICNKNPKTALDVEEAALEILYSHIDDDMFIDLKNWVYDCANRKIMVDGVEKDHAITIYDVCFVLSLPLRNMYLELHPIFKGQFF